MDDKDGYFPERVAATYDDSSEGMFDPAFVDTVARVLAGLADGGRALELGIGTGRIARPLARRGRGGARREGWGRQPFTGESTQHISVWEKPAR